MKIHHLVGATSIVGVCACSSSAGDSAPSAPPPAPPAGATAPERDAGGAPVTASPPPSSTPTSSARCSEDATFVYLLGTERELFRFKPADKVLERVGVLDCAPLFVVYSMAVDRKGTAWVNGTLLDETTGDAESAIFEVSTKDARCKKSAVVLGDQWSNFGMAFSSDGPGSEAETLYVASAGDARLGRVDFATNTVVPIGKIDTGPGEEGGSVELTGTGAGELYAYFAETPIAIGRIDKKTGKVDGRKTLTEMKVPTSAFAFSFWGGDFYLYAAGGEGTTVGRYRPSDQSSLPDYWSKPDVAICGAGVSTCAPTSPIK